MKKYSALCLCGVLSCSVNANPIDFVGYKSVTLTVPSTAHRPAHKKVIYLLKVNLSPEAKRALKGRVQEMEATSGEPTYQGYATTYVSAVNLGMNGVPVLDQGQHGSCVTFAVTGAIDAIIGKGNYVSQLCSLELGKYLVRIKKIPYSGWEGSWGDLVLNQLYTYGIVPISTQITPLSGKYRCGGLKYYPVNSSGTGVEMSIAQYSAAAQYTPTGVPVRPISAYIKPPVDPWYNDNGTTLLNNVKTALRSGQRVVFGVLLDDSVGMAGAVGDYNKLKPGYDSWVLTPSIVSKANQNLLDAGHEMIIIGYNDNAVVSNANATLNKKGLLILRNSWSADLGDSGNFYMSYEYFKLLADEAQPIIKK